MEDVFKGYYFTADRDENTTRTTIPFVNIYLGSIQLPELQAWGTDVECDGCGGIATSHRVERVICDDIDTLGLSTRERYGPRMCMFSFNTCDLCGDKVRILSENGDHVARGRDEGDIVSDLQETLEMEGWDDWCGATG